MSAPTVKVLLVEDSPSDAALLQEALTQNALGHFHFTHSETLTKAIEHLNAASFDVLLLDLSLPDCTGQQTIFRARAAAPHLPIVVLTSVEDETVGLDAVRFGIQDFLIKGQAYGRQTARSIRYAIERKRAEESLKQAELDLQKQRARLESHVQERTAALSEANRALQAEIVQRRRAEEAHRQVLRQLSQAQETERGRISRELHDRLGQELTALKLGLQLLRKQGPLPVAHQQTIGRQEAVVDRLMRDIHRLAWELRPPVLDDLGLDLALQRYTTEWSQNSGIIVDFHANGAGAQRLPAEFETALYRVAQEALTNVLRHARANRVSVLFERRPDCVSLIIEDNGQGFETASLTQTTAPQAKLGLLGMQERLTLVGGTLQIESTPGAGTTVFARLPLTPPKPAS